MPPLERDRDADERDRDADPDGRHETAAERADRNLVELLQELRVAALGVQVLFGFLLAIPFAARFTRLSMGERRLYITTLVLAAVATALLIGPVAYHRAVFHQHAKARIVAVSNSMARAGLVVVGLAVVFAVWLVVAFVCHGWPVPVITVGVACVFVAFWVVLPGIARYQTERGRPAPAPGP